jgi:hypothetical protein
MNHGTSVHAGACTAVRGRCAWHMPHVAHVRAACRLSLEVVTHSWHHRGTHTRRDRSGQRRTGPQRPSWHSVDRSVYAIGGRVQIPRSQPPILFSHASPTLGGDQHPPGTTTAAQTGRPPHRAHVQRLMLQKQASWLPSYLLDLACASSTVCPISLITDASAAAADFMEVGSELLDSELPYEARTV